MRSQIRSHLKRLALLPVVSAFALSASCGNSLQSGVGSAKRAAPATAWASVWDYLPRLPSCDWVSNLTVDSALRVKVSRPEFYAPFGSPIECTYLGKSPAPSVTILYQARKTMAMFEQEETEAQFPQPHPVSGLGSMAYSLTGPEQLDGRTTTVSDLIAWKDSTVVSVMGPGTVAQLETITKEVLPMV